MLKRYTKPEMGDLWGEESKFKHWLRVELAILEAKARLGKIDHAVFEAVRDHARFTVERIEAIDAQIGHDLNAFVDTVRESLEAAGVGEHGGQFHAGNTSYDIEDPAAILMLRRAATLIIEALEGLERTLRAKAREHKETLMIARTHGQWAEPSTFGHLLMVYAEEIARGIRRLKFTLVNDLSEGRISGAVGTYPSISPEVEALALMILGLQPAPISTQILQRDRHAALITNLAIVSASMSQAALTFWKMMASDIRELREPRSSKKKDSSAMPHKNNPNLTEQAFGIPRLIRGYALAAIEDIATFDWREISQSIVERHIFPDATSLVYYQAIRMTSIVERLMVFPERMKQNLERTLGVWASQQMKLALVEAGVPPETAYRYAQEAARTAVEGEEPYQSVLSRTPVSPEDRRSAKDILGAERLEHCFDAWAYIKPGIEHIFARCA